MRTWICWTHYDCEVNIALHGSEDDAYRDLKNNWLDECDGDCHDLDDVNTPAEIASAVEYHYDELNWGIYEVAVPPVSAQVAQNSMSLLPKAPEPPAAPPVLSAGQSGDLLASLQSFAEGS